MKCCLALGFCWCFSLRQSCTSHFILSTSVFWKRRSWLEFSYLRGFISVVFRYNRPKSLLIFLLYLCFMSEIEGESVSMRRTQLISVEQVLNDCRWTCSVCVICHVSVTGFPVTEIFFEPARMRIQAALSNLCGCYRKCDYVCSPFHFCDVLYFWVKQDIQRENLILSTDWELIGWLHVRMEPDWMRVC